MRGKKLITASLSVFLFSCATYVEGKKEEITIISHPENATVVIDKHVCLTPCEVEVEKKVEKFHIEKNGYPPKEVKIEKKISPWFWANLLFFPLGMFIDYKTGAMWDIQDEIEVNLNK